MSKFAAPYDFIIGGMHCICLSFVLLIRQYPFVLEYLFIDKYFGCLLIIYTADVVYSKKVIRPLLRTMYRLSDEQTVIFIVFEMHDYDAAQQFWKNVNNYFEMRKVCLRYLH